MSLVSQSDLEQKLGRGLTDEEANAFSSINSAVQSHIEKMIGSSVEPALPSIRYYDGDLQHLAIDPCTSLTEVKYIDNNGIGQYIFETEDYTVEPVNRTCKTMLRYRWGKFDNGLNAIAVTATYSIYADVTIRNIVIDAILTALTAEINNTSNVKAESIEGYSITYADTETKNALDKIAYLFPSI